MRELFAKNNINLIQTTASGCLPILAKNGSGRCFEVMDFVYKDFIVKHAGEIDGAIISADWVNYPKESYKDLAKEITKTVNYLSNYKIPSIVLGQSKTYVSPYPSVAAEEIEHNSVISKEFIDKQSAVVNNELTKGLSPDCYIDIYNKDDFPKLSSTGTPYVADRDHLTKYGADSTLVRILANPAMTKFFKSTKAYTAALIK